MKSARADVVVGLEPADAMALWIDAQRWSSFVEGFQRIERISDDWPAVGAEIVWDSGPEGRGRVAERVAEHDDVMFVTAVTEERLIGRQTAGFETGKQGGTLVTLILDYDLTMDKSPFLPVTNVIFIRPAIRAALDRTLRRFAVEAAEMAV